MKISNFNDIKLLFFDNRTLKQTIFKNTFWIALAIGVSKFSKLVLIIYVARILGATEYGKFAFALAFISLFVIFHNLGLPSIVTREFAREKEKEKEFYSLFSLKILLGLGALIMVLIGSFFVTPDPNIRKVIWILATFSLIGNFSTIIHAFFRARQRMEYESWATILEALIVAGAGFFVILKFPSIENLSYAYLFSSVIALVFILIFFHFKVFPLKISWQKSVWRKFLTMSWPLALASVFSTIYAYIDSVMMGYWGLMTETGWYNAAYKMVMFTTVPASIIATSFYPVLSKFFKESKEKLQSAWDQQVGVMIFLAIPLMVGGITLSARIIDFIYGQDFFPSILAFQILIIMAGIFFLSKPLMQFLIVSNQQKKIFVISFSGALINIILNLILIPKFSLYGAAIATVITYLLMLFLLFNFTFRFTPVRPLNLKLFFSFIIAGLSSIVMYSVISQSQIYNLNVFLSISIGAIIYFIAFFGLNFISKSLKLYAFNK
ncbi:MAG TPA: hypothetical protein ENH90_00485 [bacterium]|nr:hypothetical protein [bacterium]